MTIEQPFIATTKATIPGERTFKPARLLKLTKPITWFGPTWALMCGAIASGATDWSVVGVSRVFLGMLMAGPLLCGASQVINDYFDREIDSINEPDRPIPSGHITLPQVAVMTVTLIVLGTGISLFLGRGVFLLTTLGLIFAVIYSAPPFRAKRNGWIGNSLVGISYEGLAWMAGHIAFAALTPTSVMLALLYSFGTHGIMSINDYKSVDGDRANGIRTIPVMYGMKRAAWLIVATMNIAQIGVFTIFANRGQWVIAAIIAGILIAQLPVQRSFLKQPAENYLKFSAIGVNFFVWGMLVAAIGARAF